ncbi:MAG: hypothetical protein H6Q86_4428, partial [candidate division NC10 bacterium]|nr:hypothetical protein [candidate division NC10 bacterium]
MSGVSRRQFLTWGLPAGLGFAGAAVAATGPAEQSPMPQGMAHPNPAHVAAGRPIPTDRQAPDVLSPMQILTAF